MNIVRKLHPVHIHPFYFALTILIFFSTPTYVFAQEKLVNEDLENLVGMARTQLHSNLDSAMYFIDKAIDKSIEINDTERHIHLLREKGYYYEIFNRLEYALGIYQQAQQEAEKTKITAAILDVYTDLAITNRKLGNYKETKKYHTLALELAEKEDDLKGMEYALHGLGYLFETIGEHEKAVEYYLQSLEKAEERGEKPGIVTTMQNIANTYSKIGNFHLAKKTIEQAYEISLEVGDSTAITNVLHDHGSILDASGDLDGALEKFNASLIINKKHMSKGTVARSLMYIADIYTKKNHFELSEQYLVESLSYEEFMRDEDLSELYSKLGQLYLLKKDYERARNALFKSLKLSETQNYLSLVQRNNYNLYESYVRTNQTDEALYHLEKSSALKDSIYNANQSARMAELQFLYDIEKSERYIHELEAQQNKMMLIGASILFGILFLFMAYFIRLKTKNNKTLKQKNEEIQLQNIKLKESNEVLKQFAYVAAHDLKEPLRSIGSFISLFKRKYGHQFNIEANEYMTYVQNGVIRMNELLNALLKYSTISIQRASNEDIINVSTILKDVSENLRETIEVKNAKISFPENLPNLKMNPLHVTQLFQNLISNSLKFAEESPIIQIEGLPSDEQIIFCVQDNGIGMKPEYEDKIYKLFHQLDRSAEGHGIGLTICKNIVDKYDGNIWYEPNEQKGTRFLVSFPRHLAA